MLDAVIVCVRCRLLRVLDADPRVIYTHIDLDDGEFTAKQACIYKKTVC